MLAKLKLLCATACVSGAVFAGVSAPGASAQPIITGGLVNATITDVLNNNQVTLTVPVQTGIQLGANICGINAAVLAADLSQNNSATCTNTQNTQQVQLTSVA